MAVFPVRGRATLESDGAYAGTADHLERVTLGAHGMDVTLIHIDNIKGSRGDDTVSFDGELQRGRGAVRLGDGDDTLHLAGAHAHDLKLEDVEHVTGVAGATLNLRNAASFQTDGSVSIVTLHRSPSHITFTDVVDDVSLQLRPGSRDVIAFGPDIGFGLNGDGELIAVKDGRVVTFELQDPGSTSLQIVVDGQGYTYQDLLASDLVDTSRPVVLSVTASSTALGDASVGASAFSITVSFDKPMLADGSADPVLGFSPDVAGTLSLASVAWNPDGTSFTATYTVADAGVQPGAVSVDVSGAKDTVLNAQQDYSAQVEFTIDTANPTAVIVENNDDGVVSDADSAVTYTVTFSEAVASLQAADLQITGGFLASGPTLAEGGLSATFTVTAADVSTTDLVVSLKDTVVDLHGNALVPPAPLTLAVDTLNPVAVPINHSNEDGVVSSADRVVTFSVTFSEPVQPFTASDIEVTNGTVTAGPALVVSDEGTSATFQVTATDGFTGTLAVNLKNTILDVNGNPLLPHASVTIPIDTDAPGLLSIARQTPGGEHTNADTLVLRVSFDEAVSQIDAADFALTTSSTATVTGVSAVSGTTYDVTISGGDLASYNGNLSIAFAGSQDITDGAGNALPTPAGSASYLVDNIVPSVNVTDINSPYDWGFRVDGSGMLGLLPAGSGESAVLTQTGWLDWSKFHVSVNNGGTIIGFSPSDVESITVNEAITAFILTPAKITQINNSVDGTGDSFVIESGFWRDFAGNVQTTGTFTAPADTLGTVF